MVLVNIIRLNVESNEWYPMWKIKIPIWEQMNV